MDNKPNAFLYSSTDALHYIAVRDLAVLRFL